MQASRALREKEEWACFQRYFFLRLPEGVSFMI